MQDTVEAGRGEGLHHAVDDEGGDEHEDEDDSVVPAEDRGHYHHLTVVFLIPFLSNRRVENAASLEEPRPLKKIGEMMRVKVMMV